MTSDIVKQATFATGRIVHQGTGEPVVGQVQIAAQEGPVAAKVTGDGTFLLSGDLKLLFPNLATQNYQLHLDIHADSAQFHPGFIDHPVLVTIPGGPSFDPDPPTTPLALVVVPTVLLPADPTNVRGRVVEAHNPETPISGATLELLQGGPPISAVTTDADGRYRFNDVTVLAPSQIRCSKAGFKTEARPLLVDFGKLINEEYFRLAPP